MSYIFAAAGIILGIIIDFATPYSEFIMAFFSGILANPSITDPTLKFMISLLGIFTAYILLPGGFGTIGFMAGSGSGGGQA